LLILYKYGVIGKKNGSKNLKDSVNEIFSKPYPDQNIKEPGLEYDVIFCKYCGQENLKGSLRCSGCNSES